MGTVYSAQNTKYAKMLLFSKPHKVDSEGFFLQIAAVTKVSIKKVRSQQASLECHLIKDERYKVRVHDISVLQKYICAIQMIVIDLLRTQKSA